VTDKKSSRILTFDLMRGYFLVAIILDHLKFFPSGLDWWAARGDLFVTTAEGFFLISGIVLGIVRGHKLLDKPFNHVAKLLVHRGVQLYLTTIILVLIFTLMGWWFFIDNPGLKDGLAPQTNIIDLLWQIITLQYFYGWADYLRLYAIFMLVSPVALWLLRKGWWYILLAANLFFWLFFPTDPEVPDITQELLQPLTWQLIFFGGMTIGFYWNRIVTKWRTFSSHFRSITTWSVIGLAAITLTINLLITFAPDFFAAHILSTPDLAYKLYIEFFDKERLPLSRLALFFLWFWAAFALFRRFESRIVRALGWLLLPFGSNSLYVYTVHAFIIFLVHMWLRPGNIATNFIVSVSIVLLIRVMIHYKFLMNVIPR
jgi:hypothetical protein